MLKSRPPTSGYARIAQAEESDSEDEIQTSYHDASAPQYVSITQPRPRGGMSSESEAAAKRSRKSKRIRRSSSSVDIDAINARLQRWADEIASKFKINKVKGKTEQEERLEIHHSVFQAPDGIAPITAEALASDPNLEAMTKVEFEAVVESVRVAIEQGMHPKMITQGSSGSYFARNTEGKVVGVFKPKDEEPYAAGNPKWNKWIHRNLFPCFFGRACLIPNLSYVSEAAAYTLDCRLRTNLVPYTDIVHLSSKSFHYDFWSRRNFYRKKKAFPAKVGSFQVFLKGFKDANIFLREHPWPDRSGPYTPSDSNRKSKGWKNTCRPGAQDDEDDEERSTFLPSGQHSPNKHFVWTDALQQSFRKELEKLVILDYIMRNTDRGLDNWMIKVDWENQGVSIVSEPPKMNGKYNESSAPPASTSDGAESQPYRLQQPMKASSRSNTASNARTPLMSIGAIDNSLSWPWKHPDAWRSFPFGWLFLPVSLIGQPFSQKTRDHFLPLLTSKQWWSETQLELRKVFSQDDDFQERMFARQIAVMKGQAWNVVETLKTMDHGPLELTRRARVCVWDDLVDIPIATPMRVPSEEMRRRSEMGTHSDIDEEMDISVANSSAPQPDLLSMASPAADLPNPNRFELGSGRASEDTPSLSPTVSTHGSMGFDGSGKTGQVKFNVRPSNGHARGRMSYDEPSRSQNFMQPRRFSLTSRGRGGIFYDGEDLEGDLGYAAAEGMEGNRRKVIVERLETVKSKNPVFTWC
ncbi:phosphatidylinositol 3 and 4-kinase-domain-containing protein [Calycina marina]|uniref:Phosphatidylinositol 4-kinase n=1 Tax=Calycina marina TaxID=1763456 RepID=A0A9P7YY17_9HELO|nr:phosphatidylinositol 3 and 4-kinase-domain-containing protein [Calycina marina]